MANRNQNRSPDMLNVNGGDLAEEAPPNVARLQARRQAQRDRAQRAIDREIQRQQRDILRRRNLGGNQNGRGGHGAVDGVAGNIVRDGNPPNVNAAVENEAPARGQEVQAVGNAEGGQLPAAVGGGDVNDVRIRPRQVFIGGRRYDYFQAVQVRGQAAAVPRGRAPAVDGEEGNIGRDGNPPNVNAAVENQAPAPIQEAEGVGNAAREQVVAGAGAAGPVGGRGVGALCNALRRIDHWRRIHGMPYNRYRRRQAHAEIQGVADPRRQEPAEGHGVVDVVAGRQAPAEGQVNVARRPIHVEVQPVVVNVAERQAPVEAARLRRQGMDLIADARRAQMRLENAERMVQRLRRIIFEGNAGVGQGDRPGAMQDGRPQPDVIEIDMPPDPLDPDPVVLPGDAAGQRIPLPVDMIMELDNSNNSHYLDQLTSREIESEISDELSDKVFENDMLREMILNHVIISNGKVSPSDLQNVRLVRKSWLTTAAESLRKRSLPMFNLKLDTGNSTNGCQHVQRHGSKLLEMFVNSMTSSTRLPDFIPPFKLHLTQEFFLNENHRSLSDCLVSCGEAMVDLEVSFPINSPMVFAFRPFTLPQLKRLSVQFAEPRLDHIFQALRRNENYGHTIYPTQTILNSADDLKEVVFKYSPSDRHIPFGFEHLAFPKTITKLCLDRPMRNSDLQLLINNDLPNLTSLTLFSTSTPYNEETIFQILNKHRASLKTLSLIGHHYQGRVRDQTMLRLPVMEKLESVTVSSQCWEFQEGVRNLETQLPKMNDLRMLSTRESMFAKWTENSVFPEVTKLSVSLINTDGRSPNPNNVEVPMTLTLEKMQSLHLAFPNVVSLELTLCGPQTCGLKYLFMEMVSLQKLAITVKGPREHFSPSHWDSLLVGIPKDMAICLQKNPDYWGMVELKDDNNFPSIRKLTALHSLALVEALCPAPSYVAAASGFSLISDLSFHFAFLKMPNLAKLLLHGRFSASPQMCARWREEKGTEIAGIR